MGRVSMVRAVSFSNGSNWIKKLMTKLQIAVSFATFLVASMIGLAWAQYSDVNWNNYAREAIAKGKVIEALKELEAEGSAAEKVSRWDKASFFYDLASTAARQNGQLQKGLTYGQQSFDASEKAKDPVLRSQQFWES